MLGIELGAQVAHMQGKRPPYLLCTIAPVTFLILDPNSVPDSH